MVNKTHANIKRLPWYKYPMVWMVILLPALVILASTVTIYIAFAHSPTMMPVASATDSHIKTQTADK